MPGYARDALEVTVVWLLLVTRYQRWSRGHKARGQRHTKKKSEAKDSLSRDRLSQGQGQECSRPRSRTQPQVFSNKKGLQKSFLGDLQFIGKPRIFDWGRPKSQIPCNDVIKNFPNRKFLWDKDIKEWKI